MRPSGDCPATTNMTSARAAHVVVTPGVLSLGPRIAIGDGGTGMPAASATGGGRQARMGGAVLVAADAAVDPARLRVRRRSHRSDLHARRGEAALVAASIAVDP